MNYSKHPDELDCTWLSVDGAGHLGAFLTAGSGPVPLRWLNCTNPLVEDIESIVLEQPTTGGYSLLVDVPRPDSFIALASRGYFVYDWTDHQKISSESTGRFQLVALPNQPVTIDKVANEISAIALVCPMQRSIFSRMHEIDLQD
ncbi:MAG TPA: hypothetical protein VF471_03395 [Pseudoxanthomonas sp.]